MATSRGSLHLITPPFFGSRNILLVNVRFTGSSSRFQPTPSTPAKHHSGRRRFHFLTARSRQTSYPLTEISNNTLRPKTHSRTPTGASFTRDYGTTGSIYSTNSKPSVSLIEMIPHSFGEFTNVWVYAPSSSKPAPNPPPLHRSSHQPFLSQRPPTPGWHSLRVWTLSTSKRRSAGARRLPLDRFIPHPVTATTAPVTVTWRENPSTPKPRARSGCTLYDGTSTACIPANACQLNTAHTSITSLESASVLDTGDHRQLGRVFGRRGVGDGNVGFNQTRTANVSTSIRQSARPHPATAGTPVYDKTWHTRLPTTPDPSGY